MWRWIILLLPLFVCLGCVEYEGPHGIMTYDAMSYFRRIDGSYPDVHAAIELSSDQL